MVKNVAEAATPSAAPVMDRFFVVVAAFLFAATVTSAEAKIKCWTNNEGVRECGDAVPPEFAQQEYETKSAGGVTLDTADRAKTVEELEAERAAAEAAERAAVAAREEAARDKVLLYTFSSEDDMVLARDGQVAHLESQIKITQSHIDKLQKGLDELIQDAADHERRGAAPPEKLLADIDSLRTQIRENELFIETKHEEQHAIMEKFERDIARFRKLKGLD